jgi:hypothetical protein
MLNTYIDEAGTSGAPHENIIVFAGVTFRHLLQHEVSKMVARIVAESVPEHYRQGFVYHTTELLDSKKFGDKWPLAERLQVIHAGDMGNTLAPNGFGAHSTRPAS